MSSKPYPGTCEVVVAVSIAQSIVTETAERATGVAPHMLQTVTVGVTADDRHAAIDTRTVDQAVTELSSVIEGLPNRFPGAHAVHLFYSGPLALFVRSVGRLHLHLCPIYVYQWFPTAPGGGRHLRAFEPVSGDLLIGEALT